MTLVTRNQKKISEPLLMQSLAGIRAVSTGLYLPERVVTNKDLAGLGCDSEWIVQRTGIESRHRAADDEAPSDMATRVAESCLDQAGVSPDEVDLILIATMTPDHFTPSTACLTQAKLGCSNAAAMDINAACSGFVYSLMVAGNFIRAGNSQNALVIGAEKLTMIMDPEDKKTYPLFGDAAAGVLLQADPQPDDPKASGILAYRLASVGELGDCLVIPGGGSRKPCSQEVLDNRDQYLKMEGRSVFKWAVRSIPEMTHAMLDATGLALDDIDHFLFHQANKRIIDAASADLNLDMKKVHVNLERVGNTSAASVPLSLHEAVEDGRIKRGDLILIAGFGAGLTWATCIMRW